MAYSTCVLVAFIIFVLYKIINYLLSLPMVGDRQSKYIFITGCGQGFGHEAAKRFDASGLNVFAGCTSEQGETRLRKACSNRLKTITIDVRKLESVRKALTFVKSNLPEGKGLWGIINNAGTPGTTMGPLDMLEPQDYLEVFNVNVLGTVNVTKTFLPLVKKAKGRVVIVSSFGGKIVSQVWAPYVMSKWSTEAYSDILRLNMRPFGVSVHVIQPGAYKTNINTDARIETCMKTAWDRAPGEVRQEYGQQYYEGFMLKWVERYLADCKGDIDEVMAAYEHALMARFPKPRYMMGKGVTLIKLVLSLPTWLHDLIMERKDPKCIIAACTK